MNGLSSDAGEDSVFLKDTKTSTDTDCNAVPMNNFKTKKPSERCRLRTKDIVFLLVCAVLLIVCLVLGLLYTQERNNSEKNCSNVCQRATKARMCTLPACFQAAQGMVNAMDQTTDPCKDFYQYSCGGWIRDNTIPASKGSWTQMKSLQDKTRRTIRDLLESREKKELTKNNSAVQKAYSLYESCMDEERIEERGKEPLMKVVRSLGSCPVLNSSWTSDTWSALDTFAQLRVMGVHTWFQMSVGVDINNSTRYGIMIDQAGIGMKSNVYLSKNNTYYQEIRKGYKNQMLEFATLLGVEKEKAQKAVDEVYDLEHKLAEISTSDNTLRMKKLSFKRISIGKLMEETGGLLDFLYLARQLLEPTGFKVTNETMLAIFSYDYIKKMVQVFRDTPDSIKANYMIKMFISRFGHYLSKDFRKTYLDLSRVGKGTAVENPRWETCVQFTSSYMRMATGLLFINQAFQGQSKLEAKKIVNEIKHVLIEKLKVIDWMDAETRAAAIQKAKAIVEDIGYPDYIKDPNKLAEDYQFEVDKDHFFENMVRVKEYVIKEGFKNILQPVNRSEWVVGPTTVNAFYSPPINKIMFPAGILQAPFYNKDFPKALNYGGIGMVIAHEITHGFDTLGRQFDKNGNLYDWWSNTSSKAFMKKATCLMKQYSKYRMHGMKINGTKTVGENIADNGAIKLTYEAYMNWRKMNQEGEEAGLPGLELTSDQLFFVNFAQVWCSKWRKSMLKTQLLYATHTPDQFRVIGSMSNFPEFAKAFNCRKDAEMNPEHRCSVW